VPDGVAIPLHGATRTQGAGSRGKGEGGGGLGGGLALGHRRDDHDPQLSG